MKCGANVCQTNEEKTRHFIIESHMDREANRNSEGMRIEGVSTLMVPHGYASSYFPIFTNPAAHGFLPPEGIWIAAIIESKKKNEKKSLTDLSKDSNLPIV